MGVGQVWSPFKPSHCHPQWKVGVLQDMALIYLSCSTTRGLFGNSQILDIELIRLDLFEIKLFQLEDFTNRR